MRPVILVPPAPDQAEALLERFDAMLLIGGGDVEAARYGSTRHPSEYGHDAGRDTLEISLVRAARDAAVPVLAVCRGIQVVNVAFGGSLLQHLPEAGLDGHGIPGGDPSVHVVALEPGSRIAAACGTDRLRCASHHHQGLDRLGEGLLVAGRSPDGLVEAVEDANGLLMAVQWHPEETAAEDEAQQGLFGALADRARARTDAAAPGRPG
jgi:putative glutamine amidotransferase